MKINKRLKTIKLNSDKFKLDIPFLYGATLYMFHFKKGSNENYATITPGDQLIPELDVEYPSFTIPLRAFDALLVSSKAHDRLAIALENNNGRLNIIANHADSCYSDRLMFVFKSSKYPQTVIGVDKAFFI